MKRTLVVLLAICCTLLSACSLLPPEESIRVAPIIPESDSVVYETVCVERMDMVLTKTVYCTYTSLSTERLLFEAEGVAFDRYYVQLGDRVTAGQLLAELDMSDIDERLSMLHQDLSLLKLQIDALEEDRALALERRKIQMEGSSAGELAEALKDVNAQFDRRAKSLKDEVYLVEQQIQEWEAEIPKRQLRAGIDGVVHYLYDYSKDPTGSKVGTRAIRLVDPDRTFFLANTELWQYLKEGQTYSLFGNTSFYNLTVVSAGELGLEEEERMEGQKANVYLRPNKTVADMEVGDFSTIKVVLDRREDVLAVPEKAVFTVAGQSVVYYVNEDGLQAYKPVETGLEANGMVEILSGLEEGESIIVG